MAEHERADYVEDDGFWKQLDQTNYKALVDDNIRQLAWNNPRQDTIARQQEEMFQDVRAQRDQLFAQFLQLNANSLDLARNLSNNAVRMASDGHTLSIKQLDTAADDNVATSIGAKVAQDVVPEINNAIKAATADASIGAGGATALAAYNAQTTQAIEQLAQAVMALQSVVLGQVTANKEA